MKYNTLINSGMLKKDTEQEKLVQSLDELHAKLQKEPGSSSFFGRLFGTEKNEGNQTKGVYVYGSVGGYYLLLIKESPNFGSNIKQI